ncbi:unnamed protein product [Clonostachys solani]|uniref:NAD(P)-binding domain-containing protein n=1 Tax=Clonostachys solani TaxID=160281 RepID=A0A9N9ZF43_9HYPO|nr:unnamed protein product [Clonostachys solani]
MASVFITGASGFIGGQVLKAIIDHPRQYGTIRALVRDPDAAKLIEEAFPQVQTVIGDLGNVSLVEKEAEKATVVLNVASNKHIDSVRAIHRGLAKRQSPSYWVQVSGASLLAADELASSSFQPGSASDVIFDDVADAAKIRSLIRAHPSRVVDNYLLDVAATDYPKIRSAVVFPPIVYGRGEGPVNKKSIQIPALCRVALAKGRAVQVGKGLSRWGSVHVRDLARVWAELADAGANGCKVAEVWGEQGLYFPSAQDISFGEISELVARVAQESKLISSSEVEQITPEEAAKLLPGGSVFFGTNALVKSQRTEKELELKNVEEPITAEIKRALLEEAGV